VSQLNRSAPGPFHPVELPGVEFCYDAERLANQPADGASIGTWADCSGRGRHLAAVGGANPVYVDRHASYRQRPAIDFQAVDALQVAFGVTLSQPMFYAAVGAFDVTGGDRFMFDGGSGGEPNRNAFFGDSGTPKHFDMYAGASLNPTTMDTNPHVFSLLFNSTTSQYWIDGTAQTAGNAGTEPTAGLSLGATTSGTSNFLDGQIAFLVGLNYIPATDVRRRLEAWLGQRYGITVT